MAVGGQQVQWKVGAHGWLPVSHQLTHQAKAGTWLPGLENPNVP